MSHDLLSAHVRNPAASFFSQPLLGNGGTSERDPFLRALLGPRDQNDVFTRSGLRSFGAFGGGFDPRMMVELLIGLALMMQPQGNRGGGAAKMPSQSWGGGGGVPASNWGGAAPSSNGGGAAPSSTSTGPTSTQTAAPSAYGKNVVPQQFGNAELTPTQRDAGCGPLAAIGVARSLGMNPDIQQTFDLASASGWNSAGMNGPANYQRLLDKMGIASRQEPSVNAEAMKSSIEQGKPVTISTARHYFLASDYDPNTGRFFVGNSGTAMKGGKEWMTLDEISSLGAGVNGVVYV